jgi:hypothetical protein
MQDIHVKLNPDCHSKTSIQQEEGCCHQQIGLKFKEENVKFYIWCIALYGAEEEWRLVGPIL